MARKKSSSEIEHLRGIIRKQEAQIRELKKELARAKPTVIIKEPPENKEKMHTVKKVDTCPKCTKTLKKINLGVRKMLICEDDSCQYQELIKKSN